MAVVAAALAPGGLAWGQSERPTPEHASVDRMIHAYLNRATAAIEARFHSDDPTLAEWQAHRYHDEYMDILGLAPEPPRCDLKAKVASVIDSRDFLVENLHYQSIPGLYVTANLYRPERPGAEPAESGRALRLRTRGQRPRWVQDGLAVARHLARPARLFVSYCRLACSSARSLASTTAPIAKDVGGGTRGVTRPFGVECRNGMRGIDYLASRPDVDPRADRRVTGISGGGAATFWIAAADDRGQGRRTRQRSGRPPLVRHRPRHRRSL